LTERARQRAEHHAADARSEAAAGNDDRRHPPRRARTFAKVDPRPLCRAQVFEQPEHEAPVLDVFALCRGEIVIADHQPEAIAIGERDVAPRDSALGMGIGPQVNR